MWDIRENKKVLKIVKKIPKQALERYEFWKNLVEIKGPNGLKSIKGFHDEALKGEWKGYRSSRLNIQWRVIYKVFKKEVVVIIVEISSHKYNRKK